MENNEIVSVFAAHLAEDGKSPKTVKSYVGDVSAFMDYLARMGADLGGGMRRAHVTAYRGLLVDEGYGIL